MSDDRAPNVNDLAQALELRWRIVQFVGLATDALAIGLAASLLAVIVNAAFDLSMPLGRIVLLVNGAAVVAALLVAAVRRRDASRFLIDADATYGLKSALVSAYEFGREPTRGTGDRHRAGFERLAIERGEEQSEEVDPHTVYPWRTPRRLGAVAALVVSLGILVILDASGWFERPVPPYQEQAQLLQDAGRRLAERAGNDEDLQALADEIRRLGERVQSQDLTVDQARRQIDLLRDRVDEQIRNLDRTPEFETNEDAQIPPESEETIRRALESGMSQGDVVDLFTRMRSEGNTVPDVVKALENATPDRAPDANVPIDDEEMQRLLDQLNQSKPPSDEPSDIVNDLKNSQRVLQQAGSGLSELAPGEPSQVGSAGPNGVSRAQRNETDVPNAPETESQDSQSGGQQGGRKPVTDESTDDFQRPEDLSPIFREIHGVMTDNTIMDVIIRELPSEATSNLTEQQRDVLFERVVEEAVDRESTPQELQSLVRNYFLRLTHATEEGASNEQ